MAFKTFTSGAVLTAAEVNTYLMQQSVIVCTAATRPSAPVEGMRIVETDTDLEFIYTGAAWIQMGGFGAWTAYTPVWSSTGTQPAVGNGTIVGRYMRQGRLITFSAALTIGSTSSGGTGNYAFSLPFTAVTVAGLAFAVTGYIGAAATHPMTGSISSGAATVTPMAYGNSLTFANAAPTLAATNFIIIGGTYEAAS